VKERRVWLEGIWDEANTALPGLGKPLGNDVEVGRPEDKIGTRTEI